MDPTEVSLEMDGLTYTGEVHLLRNILTVDSAYGRKTYQVSTGLVESVARRLPQEIVRAEMARKNARV
ncbi:MAG TPA: hypothetical protein VIL09_10645 [Microvirga sp.]|jgi:hypothetical protein